MENVQIAECLDEIADLLELKDGEPFRVRAYRNAARTVRDHPARLEELIAEGKDLAELPNIGKSTAQKLHEIVESGTCARLEELRRALPPGLTALIHIPRLGPRKAMLIYRELGICTLDDLERACKEQRVRELPGMGAKTEEHILAGIATLRAAAGRCLYNAAADQIESLARHLDKLSAVRRWEPAGSFRRRKETIGDLDILVQADDRQRATEQILGYKAIAGLVNRGPERVSVTLESGLQVDFRFFEPESFGAALMYFTGSKAHNIALRKRAVQRGWKLSEYGLSEGKRQLAGRTEAEVFAFLGLPWIPPELREDRGELEAAERNELPALVDAGDIRGDLQSHTKVTDGKGTIEEMAAAARARGYQYFAITDHSKAVAMAHGLDEERLRRHVERIREVNEHLRGLWLMAGIEVDILRDGRLDLDEKVLAELDWVVASVHYHHDLDTEAMTRRLVAAISSGVVHCLGHPTGRILGQREPIRFDADRVFAACLEHDVALEVNAQPDRLDLPDTLCKAARDAGLKFTIATDAHSASQLAFMPLGVHVARRGWLRKQDVLNTLSAREFRRRLLRR